MSVNKKRSGLRTAIIAVLAAVAACCVIITFGGGSTIPDWDDIYALAGISQDVPDCDDFVRFLDVGQGDSILISSNGRSAIIDTSTEEYGDIICRKLHSSGVKSLDMMMLSHNHDDHYGGAQRVTERFLVDNLIMPDIINTENPTTDMKAIMTSVLADDGDVFTAVQGMNVNIGDFTVTVLACYYDEEEENNRSIFAMAEIDGIRFLLTGDAEKAAEKRLLEENLSLECDVLKVGHHGAKTSSSSAFLEACNPQYAVISCGAGNQYSHPHEDTLSRLDAEDIKFYRTDLNGDVTFNISNRKILIETEK